MRSKRAWLSSEPVQDIPRRKPQRLPQLPIVAGTSPSSPRSLPKAYPRLQTLTQLTNTYVRSLHTGNFVARSELRWQNFDGSDLPNSARDRSINTVTHSAALVIQCSWRRHKAVAIRQCLTTKVWQRQLDMATKITRHSSSLTRALQVMVSPGKPHLLDIAVIIRIKGLYFHAPAQLLSWWLGFTCAQLIARRILRHPPVVVRAVDVPIKLTRTKLVQLWRCVVPLAVLMLQCSVRVFQAKRVVAVRRLERRRLEAAFRLQGFFRVYNAHNIARRLRRWYSAVQIQCFWRCHHARQCLQQRRVARIATCVCTPLILKAAKQATAKLHVRSAQTIQKYYRGCRARAQFRELLSCYEQRKWRQNPSKGFDFFEAKRYDLAALYLENCFQQGIFTGELLPTAQPVSTDQSTIIIRESPHRTLMSGSRISFSFSTAPTQLGTDWILQRDCFSDGNHSKSGIVRLAGRLQFWLAYAISHFRVFEVTGNVLNLNQARVGWESYLQADMVIRSWVPFQVIATSLAKLRFRSQFELARCLFWSGKSSEKDQALRSSLDLLRDINSRSSLGNIVPSDVAVVEAQLLMQTSMLYFEKGFFAESCIQLEKMLDMPAQSAFTDLEIRFTLALVLLKRHEEKYAGSNEGPRTDDSETSTFMRTARQLLKQCYRIIELWPSVGFYHGRLETREAKKLVATEQVGSFLLHHLLDAAGTDYDARKLNKSLFAEKTILQVKISDHPLRVASLRIEFTDTGIYKTRKMPDYLGHFSLHGLVGNLPPEAGVQMELGIRKALYRPSLLRKLEHSELLKQKLSMRSRLLHWNEWERKINETMNFSDTARWKRRNETWSTVCFEVGKALECHEAWVFAEVAAREALLHSKDRSLRANLNFLAARVTINMQKRKESALLMQQARLEMLQERTTSNTHLFIDNLASVQRALSRNVSLSKQESFSSRLKRLQKLERLCLKAWRSDSLAPRFRGEPFREALLLQRIADEMYAECGDTFFMRSLLKAHVRAYVGNDLWYESLHLKCAYTCIAQLFKRFHSHQDTWVTHLEKLTNHVQGETQSKRILSKTHEFNIKLLLLSWHHIPFLLCFEMAEVLYRYKSHSASTLVDMYESLYGRLRGSQPRTPVYTAYEELILIRLSFLHVSKVSTTENSWRHLDAAISSINEILDQRKDRALFFTSKVVKKRAKRLQWPCLIQSPFFFSDAEVLFIRGFFVQLKEEKMRIPVERRNSWRDYGALHHELMEIVAKSASLGEIANSGGRVLNSVRYRGDNLQGLRIVVGATLDVAISNMLRSQPFVLVRHEGKATPTRTPPTWTNLSPSWEEDLEIPVSSARSIITISVMNRIRRNSWWQDAETIGYVSVAMQDLLAAHDGITEGKYYELNLLKSPSQPLSCGSETRHNKVARIFLSFQVIVKPQAMIPPSAKQTASWTTRNGNWDVENVRKHLHGDLQIFVSTRWIWSRFANVFMQDKDLFIAKWFFVKSVRLTPELQRRTSKVGTRLNTIDSLGIVNDLVGLSYCYRANLCDLKRGEQYVPLLEQAEALLVRKTPPNKCEYCSFSNRAALEKQLIEVRELLADAHGTSKMIGPLKEALSRETPATSEWVKISNRTISGDIAIRYFSLDTGEIFHSKWRVEPLEYEDKEEIMVDEQKRLPHRIVVMTIDMKARVSFYRQELLRCHANDPFQWIAVFNDRKNKILFYSPYSPEAYSDLSASQPPTYVMLADEFLLYHVLLVQDAYRKHRYRRRRQRRLRGVLVSAYLAFRELMATRRRNVLRSLNCVRVVVEKAQNLRAGDLLSSDPFVTLSLTDPTGEVVSAGETSVRYNSLNPKWNEEFHMRYCFTDHEIQQQRALNEDTVHLQDAVLTLIVFDHDVVVTRKIGNKEQSTVDEDNAHGNGSMQAETEQHKCNGDFLGMVTIPIQTFNHNKCMTADLPLLDKAGRSNSPRTRGTLTVSVHWTHCDDEDKEVNATKLWAIGSGGGRALIAKKAKNRSELPEKAAQEIELLHLLMEQLLQLLLSMATDVVEPMYRLRNRMKIAQAKGKTAEEAKTLEQRLDDLLRIQLLPKLKLVRDVVARQIDHQLPVVLKMLFGPIEQYLSSFDHNSRRELRSSMEKCLDELNATTYVLKTIQTDNVTYTDAMEIAVNQHKLVKVWNDQLRQTLEMFFIGEKAQWQFTLQENVDEMYAKLTESTSGGSRRREGKIIGRPATAAVAMRMERIERAKQEKAWYEL